MITIFESISYLWYDFIIFCNAIFEIFGLDEINVNSSTSLLGILYNEKFDFKNLLKPSLPISFFLVNNFCRLGRKRHISQQAKIWHFTPS